MNIESIGEFGLINRFKDSFNHLVPKDFTGIGDDCAIVPNEKFDYLLSTDMLVENIHFVLNSITPYQLGYKSLAVNLSDIAAMGGEPIGSFLSISVPKGFPVEYLDEFFKGYHQLSETFGVPLLGGDTTKSAAGVAINVTIFGKCPKGEALKRSAAKAGDKIFVTGTLGDSSIGLDALARKASGHHFLDFLIKKHYEPTPRIHEGIWLRNQESVHAMIDISDGIASDLKHVVQASKVSAEIQLNYLPTSYALNEIAEAFEVNPLNYSLIGGEDYELLFTVAQEDADNIRNGFKLRFGEDITEIGVIKEGGNGIVWKMDEEEVEVNLEGFNHFNA
ncbi:MAG: thiamine-phosphate kinase [Bacteroidetes bacterium]|nr:MAG: thiamine-phosphate kinase [Bacteroidota bacterium]